MVILVKPDLTMKDLLNSYKQEFFDNNEMVINGSASIDEYLSIEQWLLLIDSMKDRNNLAKPEWVEMSQFVLIDKEKELIIGMINIRHYLNEYLSKFGGHVGYSVRPSQRNKGYAKVMLELAKQYLQEKGLKKILLTCDDTNIASIKTIESCGGLLENKIDKNSSLIRRYWIKL
jgi:predicted acetyltransferase